MQEDPAVVIALVPARSNQMGLHITSDCCAQRSCSAKLYALRTGRHGGQRERRLTRPSRKNASNWLEKRSLQGAYSNIISAIIIVVRVPLIAVRYEY